MSLVKSLPLNSIDLCEPYVRLRTKLYECLVVCVYVCVTERERQAVAQTSPVIIISLYSCGMRLMDSGKHLLGSTDRRNLHELEAV